MGLEPPPFIVGKTKDLPTTPNELLGERWLPYFTHKEKILVLPIILFTKRGFLAVLAKYGFVRKKISNRNILNNF